MQMETELGSRIKHRDGPSRISLHCEIQFTQETAPDIREIVISFWTFIVARKITRFLPIKKSSFVL